MILQLTITAGATGNTATIGSDQLITREQRRLVEATFATLSAPLCDELAARAPADAHAAARIIEAFVSPPIERAVGETVEWAPTIVELDEAPISFGLIESAA